LVFCCVCCTLRARKLRGAGAGVVEAGGGGGYHGAMASQWARASTISRIHDHTQTRPTQ